MFYLTPDPKTKRKLSSQKFLELMSTELKNNSVVG
jgi:hypothetical protein